MTSHQPQPAKCVSPLCDAAAWDDVIDHGGPLPSRLLLHIAECPACAKRVRQVNEVRAGLTLLRTQTVPRQLVPRTHGKALLMLRRATRASAAAKLMLDARPHLRWGQRVHLHVARASMAAVAAVLLIMVRFSFRMGTEQTVRISEQLAQLHFERHQDANGEWLKPPVC